jgi:NADH:ubiquinone oxidoreductase subunit 3 (subunit A)
MLYNYLALIIFIVMALFIPYSLLLTSVLMRKKLPENAVKNAPYESAEDTIGSSLIVQIEYLPIFAMFLPFEIISVVVLLWASVARYVSYYSGLEMMGLMVVAMVFGLISYKFISDSDV